MHSAEEYFPDDSPFMGSFVDASFAAHDEKGNWRIPDKKRAELMVSLGLSPGQLAAYT